MNKPILSREFKLMLDVNHFAERNKDATTFMKKIGSMIETFGGQVKQKPEEKVRRTWYLDTSDHSLRHNNFVLRLREEMEASKRYKLTLKHRNPDRYISAGCDVTVSGTAAIKGADVETKFEEDIISGFVSRFAHSTSVRFKAQPDLQKMADILQIFPGLRLLGIDQQARIIRVNNFEAYEIKREAGKFDFGQEPKVKPCLSFWYPSAADAGQPCVAEFSFDYDLSKTELKRLKKNPQSLENFPLAVATSTAEFFKALPNQPEMANWFNPTGTTKTAYAYEKAC